MRSLPAQKMCFSGKDFEGNPNVFVEITAHMEKVGKDEDLKRLVRITSASDSLAKKSLYIGEATESPDKTLIVNTVPEKDLSEEASVLFGRKKKDKDKKDKQIY